MDKHGKICSRPNLRGIDTGIDQPTCFRVGWFFWTIELSLWQTGWILLIAGEAIFPSINRNVEIDWMCRSSRLKISSGCILIFYSQQILNFFMETSRSSNNDSSTLSFFKSLLVIYDRTWIQYRVCSCNHARNIRIPIKNKRKRREEKRKNIARTHAAQPRIISKGKFYERNAHRHAIKTSWRPLQARNFESRLEWQRKTITLVPPLANWDLDYQKQRSKPRESTIDMNLWKIIDNGSLEISNSDFYNSNFY